MQRLRCLFIMIAFVTGLILSWHRGASASPFTFQINRFQVLQLGMGGINFVDSFDDGIEPPSGPNGANTYQTFGTFGSGDESGGSLVLDSIGAANTFSAFVPGDVAFLNARLSTPILQSAGGFAVVADFAGILPADIFADAGVREQYRIRLRDVGSSNVPEAVGVRVINVGGIPRINFFYQDFSTVTFNSLGNLFPGMLSPEISLGMIVDPLGNVSGFFDPDGPSGVAGWTLIGGSATIFNGENFTFAEFSAVGAPVPEPGTLLLIGFGLAGVGMGIRRRNRKND